ncbi:hypothetical protein ACJ41O_013556 [Fusarium nematophilum]
MAKSLAASLLLLSGVAAALTHNPASQSLKSRQDFCGTDQYGLDWYCVYEDTECCVGSVQGVCMPAGYQCCDTGYYCGPDADCYRDDTTQYCVSSGDSGADATRTAESKSVGETSAPEDPDEDSEEDPDKDSEEDPDEDSEEDPKRTSGGSKGKKKKGSSSSSGDDGDDDESNAAMNAMGSKVMLLLPLLGALAALM